MWFVDDTRLHAWLWVIHVTRRMKPNQILWHFVAGQAAWNSSPMTLFDQYNYRYWLPKNHWICSLIISLEVGDPGSVPEAVSVFGFAFYIQPMMMPLLLEMPKGKVGVKLTSWSARIVVLGIHHLAKLHALCLKRLPLGGNCCIQTYLSFTQDNTLK